MKEEYVPHIAEWGLLVVPAPGVSRRQVLGFANADPRPP